MNPDLAAQPTLSTNTSHQPISIYTQTSRSRNARWNGPQHHPYFPDATDPQTPSSPSSTACDYAASVTHPNALTTANTTPSTTGRHNHQLGIIAVIPTSG